MEQFVDRDVELDQLTDCYESETADLVVIYGRSHLGKSELVVIFSTLFADSKTSELGQP